MFCALSAQNRYATERLRGIAVALGMVERIGGMADGDYRDSFSYKSFPLHVVIEEGEVRHIGWSLPPASENAPALRLVERAALEKSLYKADALPADWDCPDEAFCAKGSVESVLMAANADIAYRCSNVQGRQYQVSWSTPGGKTLCMVVFPINYELLSGATLREMEGALYERLRSLPSCTEPLVGYGMPLVRKEDSNYTIVSGPARQGSLLENVIYLSADTCVNEPQLIFAHRFPVESLANAVSSTIASQGITANVKMMMYGVSDYSRKFTMPLSALVGYFLRQGCTPYWGLMEDDRAGGITLAVKMVNADQGYVHLLKVTADTKTLFGSEPAVEVTLAAYVNDKTTQEIIYE